MLGIISTAAQTEIIPQVVPEVAAGPGLATTAPATPTTTVEVEVATTVDAAEATLTPDQEPPEPVAPVAFGPEWRQAAFWDTSLAAEPAPAVVTTAMDTTPTGRGAMALAGEAVETVGSEAPPVPGPLEAVVVRLRRHQVLGRPQGSVAPDADKCLQ